MGAPTPNIQVRDRSMTSPGGELSGNRATPANFEDLRRTVPNIPPQHQAPEVSAIEGELEPCVASSVDEGGSVRDAGSDVNKSHATSLAHCEPGGMLHKLGVTDRTHEDSLDQVESVDPHYNAGQGDHREQFDWSVSQGPMRGGSSGNTTGRAEVLGKAAGPVVARPLAQPVNSGVTFHAGGRGRLATGPAVSNPETGTPGTFPHRGADTVRSRTCTTPGQPWNGSATDIE